MDSPARLSYPIFHFDHRTDNAPAIDLPANVIDVWSFSLAGSSSQIVKWHDLLDAAEQARAQRFHFELHRNQFIVAHGITRCLLGRYANLKADVLEFKQAQAGKPSLSKPAGLLQFSLSHSHDRGLLAVARQPIGVDLEAERSNFEHLELADRFFFGSEIGWIRARAASDQTAAFFRLWVAKEAVLKAQGIGLGYPLDAFELQFNADNGSDASIRSSSPVDLMDHWRVRFLPSQEGWPAALAFGNSDAQVRVRS